MDIKVPMDRRFAVTRLVVPDAAKENSREFMLWAAEALAKEMIATGAVRFTSQFDITQDKTVEIFTVLAGFPKTRRLP